LPNIADADIISAFLSETTNKTLVHKLRQKSSWTTKELLDITTSHASGEEAVRAIFDRAHHKAKRDEDTDEGASNHSKMKKRTSHGPRTRLWPPPSARARRHPPRAP
jgi:hypothetical protein